MSALMTYRWTGEAMEPLHRFHNAANAEFVIGETYDLEVIEPQSARSRNHQFAWLREAWLNLPETLADQYPTVDHLRKRALIAAGFYDEQIIDAGTRAAALRVAAGVRARPGEAFSVVFVRDVFVIIRTAKSQSQRAMKTAEFQASKTAILETVAEMIGVSPDQLSRSSHRSGGVNSPAEAAA